MSSSSPVFTNPPALDPVTVATLAAFDRRRRLLLWLRCVAIAVLSFLSAILVVALCDYLWLISDSLRLGLSMAAYTVTAVVLWYFGLRHLRPADPQVLAKQFELTAPRIRDDLLSAVELADPQYANGSIELQQRLQSVVARRMQLLDIAAMLPIGLVQRWLTFGGAVFLVCLVLLFIPSLQFGRRLARAAFPIAAIERASQTQITIIEPSPATRYVAEGDAVAVVVEIGGVKTEDVLLQWIIDEQEYETPMLSRRPQLLSADDRGTASVRSYQDADVALGIGDDRDPSKQFAANLAIGSTVVRYRVIARDAATLWHTLSPLARPKVTSFEKRYQFPAYAKLDDLTETAEHGDLKAITGSTAHLTIRFDQPVRDASLRYGNHGVSIPIEPLDDSNRSFQVSLPIKTPGHYQVDAFSRESDLNNPFSPQYTVTPVVDLPPVVRWGQQVGARILASPLDVLSFSASIEDDLPIDHGEQEFIVNTIGSEQMQLHIEQPDRKIEPRWQWDLMHRSGSDAPESVKLTGGDVVRTRVVAIDRRGQRGESNWIEVLIVDEGFDKDRHHRLDTLRSTIDQSVQWLSAATAIIEQTQIVASPLEASAFEDADKDMAIIAELKTLTTRQRELIKVLEPVITASPDPAEATNLLTIGLGVIDLKSKIDSAAMSLKLEADSPQKPDLDDTDDEALKRQRRKVADRLKNLKNEVSRVDHFARSVLAQQLMVGVLSDVASLHQSMLPVAESNGSIPASRVPRYVHLAEARMHSIDQLIALNDSLLPDYTQRRLENWSKFSASWQIRLRNALKEPPGEENLNALVQQFARELQSQRDSSLIDNELASKTRQWLFEIRRQLDEPTKRVRELSDAGRKASVQREKLRAIDAATEAAKVTQIIAEQQGLYQHELQDALWRLENEELLERSRPSANLRFAADMKLMQRALKHVNENGYKAFKEEPPWEVHENLAKAYSLITAAHQATLWQSELQWLAVAEHRLISYPESRLEHPLWIERVQTGIDAAAQSLKQSGVPAEHVEELNRVRYGDSFNRASERITSRRWKSESPLAADEILRPSVEQFKKAVDGIKPLVEEARQTITRYVPDLTQQARSAAEKAAEAKQRTQQREDSSRPTAEQLAAQQKEAEQATAETLQSLADRANNIDISDVSERQLARDADAASAQISDHLQQAQQAMQQAVASLEQSQRSENLDQAATALQQLKESLEQTAEHFELAEQGQDVSRSREELRQAAEQLEADQQLQKQLDQAAAMADAASKSPQQLLAELEKELQRNVPMQQELSEIAEQTAQSATRSLRQAAQDERTVQQDFEKSDPALKEEKTRMQQRLDSLANQISTVQNAILNPGNRAADAAKQSDLKKQVANAQRTLQDAAEQIRQQAYGEPRMSDLHEAATLAADAIAQAKQALLETSEQADRAAGQEISSDEQADEQAVERAQRDSLQLLNESRNERTRATHEERKRWSERQRDAGRRISEAQREKRNAETQKQRAEQELKKNPDHQWHREELAGAEERIKNANAAEQAARQSQGFAKQMQQQVEQQTGQLQSERIDPLEQPNPAAQAAERLTNQAADELAVIGEQLSDLVQQSENVDSLRPTSQAAQQAVANQQAITAQTESASDQVSRAARHEQRLGKDSTHQLLSDAADSIEANAVGRSRDAEQAIESAVDAPLSAPLAAAQMQRATAAIETEANKLSELLDGLSAQAQSSADGSPSSEATQRSSQQNAVQDRAKQLAQTLDELDRALAQRPPGDSSQGDPSEGDPQQQQANSTAEQPSSQSQSSAEASPTLASSLDQRRQQMARQRQNQVRSAVQPSSSPPDPNAPRQSGQMQSLSQGSDSTAMEPGGKLDSATQQRRGNQWGQLRQRRTDDATEIEAGLGSPEYQQQIEAYFQAIAIRAAEQSE